MTTHNIYFHGEIRKIYCGYPHLSVAVNCIDSQGLHHQCIFVDQGPVVQSIVSLTSSLVVKILTVLVSTSNSQLFLLKKCE